MTHIRVLNYTQIYIFIIFYLLNFHHNKTVIYIEIQSTHMT